MDPKLLLHINQDWTSPGMDRFMALLSSWDVWGPLLLIAGIAILIRGGFHARAWVLTAAAIVGIGDGLVAKPLKSLVDRPRPHQSVAGVRQVDLAKARPRILALAKPVKIKLSPFPGVADVDGRSFPSSHTVNTACVAVTTMCFFGWRAWAICLLPLGVGYSRIYTGSHWPTDIAISLLLGVGLAILLVPVAAALWARLTARYWPAVHARHPELLPA